MVEGLAPKRAGETYFWMASMADKSLDIDTSQRLMTEFSAPSMEEWHAEVVRLLKGIPYEKKMLTHLDEGVTLRPMYTNAESKEFAEVALPGEFPYTRSTHTLGYQEKHWHVAQELPFPTYEEFNKALRHDLERGQTAINLVLDEATQNGLDPDNAATGTVGKNGTSISSVVGLRKALEGVKLNGTPLYVESGSAALPFAALVIATLRKEGVALKEFEGAFGMDPIAGLATHGKMPLTMERAYDELAQLTEWAKEAMPKAHTLAANGMVYSDAGANAAQEIAFLIATAVETLREMEKRGLSVDEVAPRIRFTTSVGNRFFTEIAKFRALRTLWAKIVKAAGGNDEACKITMHARTARINKTLFDPYVNMLRTTTEAFSAVMGGVDSIHVAPFDEPYGLPSEIGRRIARNTQTILSEESNFTKVVDPAGGSWFVENHTRELEEKAWEIFQKIEADGGILAALKAGKVQAMIAETAAARRKKIATRKQVIVGTNKYANSTEKLLEKNVPDFEKIHEARSARLQQLRTSAEHKENVKVIEALQAILDTEGKNIVEAVVDAADKGATIGEFTRALRHDADASVEIEALKPIRLSEQFENLRIQVEEYRAKNGSKPQVFLANVTPSGRYMARVDFTRSFFQVAGFEIAGDAWFEDAEAAAKAAIDSGAPFVVAVSLDDVYPEAVPTIAKNVKAANANATVLVAGYPKEHIDAFKEAGVDEFVHVKSDVFAVLSALAEKLGVK